VGPLFDPHVTLLGGIRWETAKVVRQCKELAASLRPFEIHLGKENFERASKRSIFYPGMMERSLTEEGLPTELVFLAQIESGFDLLALSSANARGLWQFIPETGRRYGLRQTMSVDERSDPVRSTRAAPVT
jgi:transglycosylase-like protein with SLT domain